MRHFILLFFISYMSLASAQNNSWGTGIELTAKVNGNKLDISGYDTDLKKNVDTSVAVGSNPVFKYAEGVVVGYGSDLMVYITYDLEFHKWSEAEYKIGLNGQIYTSDGMVLGYGNYNLMNYSIYDPNLHLWNSKIDSVSNSINVKIEDGVIVGNLYGDSLILKFYDFEIHNWFNESFGFDTLGTTKVSGGVVAAYTSSGEMFYSIFDHQLHRWMSSSKMIGKKAKFDSNSGLVAGYGDLGFLHFAAYNFSTQLWDADSVGLGNSGTFSLDSGTINFSGDSVGKRGYDYGWVRKPSKARCKFIPIIRSNDPWVYMRSMTMGATTVSYLCGDGHQISKRQGWKKYFANNVYNAEVDVSNATYNSSCSVDINIDLDAVQPHLNHFRCYPNPTNGIFNIQLPNINSIEYILVNNLGQEIDRKSLIDVNQFNLMLPSSGIFFIRIRLDDQWYTKKIECIRY